MKNGKYENVGGKAGKGIVLLIAVALLVGGLIGGTVAWLLDATPVVENTFTVSGMVFQDAYNLDLDRLRRCYICEVDTDKGMIPFCAYNLTDNQGRALYRK